MNGKTLQVVMLLALLGTSCTSWAAGTEPAGSGTPAADKEASTMPAPLVHDLSDPQYTPPETPAWAREEFPKHIKPYVGKNGLAHPRRNKPGPMGTSVKGLDRYQANNFLFYRPETAEYIYREYTPLKVDYKPGTLPSYEKVAAKYTAGCATDTEKALALLTKALPEICKHPTVPPRGAGCRADRNLDDEALLKSGNGWCNEQARVFVRLCQVCGIPARIVHGLNNDNRSGHTLSEFYADGRWAMADSSWFCVFPGKDGRLMSAAQAHDGGEGQKYASIAYVKRFRRIAEMSDEELNMPTPEALAKLRKEMLETTPEQAAAKLSGFAVINYPLPR